MKRAAMIIAKELFRDEEYFHPKELLEKAGIEVVTISTETGTATGKLGEKTKIDALIGDIKTEDFDAIIFVGGPGSYAYQKNEDALRIAREAVQKGKILGGICAASAILAYAGVLKGKRATSFKGVSDILLSHGAIYEGKGVEVDGKIITADGPDNAYNFGQKIIEGLK